MNETNEKPAQPESERPDGSFGTTVALFGGVALLGALAGFLAALASIFAFPTFFSTGTELSSSDPPVKNMWPLIKMLLILAVPMFFALKGPIMGTDLLFAWLKPQQNKKIEFLDVFDSALKVPLYGLSLLLGYAGAASGFILFLMMLKQLKSGG